MIKYILILLIAVPCFAIDYYINKDNLSGGGLPDPTGWTEVATIPDGYDSVDAAGDVFHIFAGLTPYTPNADGTVVIKVASANTSVRGYDYVTETNDSMIVYKPWISGAIDFSDSTWIARGTNAWSIAIGNLGYVPWRVFYDDEPLDTCASLAQFVIEDDSCFYVDITGNPDSLHIALPGGVALTGYQIEVPHNITNRAFYDDAALDDVTYENLHFEKYNYNNGAILSAGDSEWIRCTFRHMGKDGFYPVAGSIHYIEHCIFYGNLAAGIYYRGTNYIYNCAIWKNGGYGITNGGGTATGDYNFSWGNSTNFHGYTPGSHSDSTVTNVDFWSSDYLRPCGDSDFIKAGDKSRTGGDQSGFNTVGVEPEIGWISFQVSPYVVSKCYSGCKELQPGIRSQGVQP